SATGLKRKPDRLTTQLRRHRQLVHQRPVSVIRIPNLRIEIELLGNELQITPVAPTVTLPLVAILNPIPTPRILTRLAPDRQPISAYTHMCCPFRDGDMRHVC